MGIRSLRPFALLGIFATFWLWQACSKPNAPVASIQSPVEMNSDSAWSVVDSLDEQMLYRSAQQAVLAISAQARERGDAPEQIKSAIYLAGYAYHLNEDAFEEALLDMEASLTTVSGPDAKVMHSLLGEMYSAYLWTHAGRIGDRTEVDEAVDPEDLQSWTAEQIFDKATEHYFISVADHEISNVSTSDYAILLNDTSALELRPTLYDVLVHRAVDLFQRDIPSISDPDFHGRFENPELIAPAQEFVDLDLDKLPNPGLKHQALVLLQDLIAINMQSGREHALVHTDLRRLQLVEAYLTIPGASEMYLDALEQLFEITEGQSASVEVMYRIAQHQWEMGSRYRQDDASTHQYRDYLSQARALCERAVDEFPKTYGAYQCEILLHSLLQKALQASTESVWIPGENHLLQLSYRNVNQAFVRVVSLDEATYLSLHERHTEQIRGRLFAQSVIQEWSFDLPGTEDLREHSTEAKIPALPPGTYAIIVSDGPEFGEEQITSYITTQVSGIAWWHEAVQGDNRLIVVDRKTGEPISAAKLELYTPEYDASRRTTYHELASSGTTNRDGEFSLKGWPGRKPIVPRITVGEDVLFDLGSSVYNREIRKDRPDESVLLFSDRSMYRPGQSIFFKGYLVERDQDKLPTLAPDRKLEIEFRDANGQVVSRMKVTTNRYGTFSGEFVAPESGLTGRMTMQVKGVSGRRVVRVEEYKRPTFEVEFEPITESVRLGDSARLSGTARTFNGVPVQQGGVRYRIVRRERPIWGVRGMYGVYREAQMEVASGTAVTDLQGAFEVKFATLTETDRDTRFNHYVYEVTAVVTDIGGETRSARTSLECNAYGYRFNIDINRAYYDIAKLDSIQVESRSLQGAPFRTNGTLTIERLESPDSPLRNRLWRSPDMPLLSDEDYQRDFPSYATPVMGRIETWDVAETIAELQFSAEGTEKISTSGAFAQAGAFRVTATIESPEGEPLVIVRNFYGHDFGEGTLDPSTLWVTNEPGTAHPGEEVLLQIISNEDLHVRRVLDRRNGAAHDWQAAGTDGDRRILIDESDRGGIRYNFATVVNGRFYSFGNSVHVPWTNKKLAVKLLTYHDQLAPGQQDEWALMIEGPDREGVVAELMATMYDASLDALYPQGAAPWGMSLFPFRRWSIALSSPAFGQTPARSLGYRRPAEIKREVEPVAPNFNWFGFDMRALYYSQLNSRTMLSAIQVDSDMPEPQELMDVSEKSVPGTSESVPPVPEVDTSPQIDEPPSLQIGESPPLQIRSDMRETVFFEPHAVSEDDGRLLIRFTMPDALTSWRFKALAHTTDLKVGTVELTVTTTQDVMIFPQLPRFLRQNDELALAARLFNNSDQRITGEISLKLFNARTGDPVNADFDIQSAQQGFEVDTQQTAVFSWLVKVPADLTDPIRYQIVAATGTGGDGQEGILPVITNKVFITETKALFVPAESTRTFALDMLTKQRSSDFKPTGLTVEFTSNPAWLAVKALPYLQEYPYGCTEQEFNRLYANLIARKVLDDNPEIETVLGELLSSSNEEDILSQLANNQELKSALLEETPWLRDALSEDEQLREMARLFDRETLYNETSSLIRKLQHIQLANGGFPWFEGGRDNWYVTQYLIEGFGHLDKLGAIDPSFAQPLQQMLTSAIRYVDRRVSEVYHKMKEQGQLEVGKRNISSIAAHYLYARSFYPDVRVGDQDAYQFFLNQAADKWQEFGLYEQGLIFLALHRSGKYDSVTDVMLKSFQERSIVDEGRGRFWKAEHGMYWYQLPIERHALFIELFIEASAPKEQIDQLRQYLLSHKQTNRWHTTKATSAAIYALLMHQDNWLSGDPVQASLGGQIVEPGDTPLPGDLYFKSRYTPEEVPMAAKDIEVVNSNTHAAWGGAYFQYFESIDAVTPDNGDELQLKKTLTRETLTSSGPVLEPVESGMQLNVGDKVVVRLEIRTDRQMEFVHIKDMRGSGFEPVNVLSGYRWQGALGYYESTRDQASHFFIDQLPRGTWVLEYSLRVTHQGTFSSGLATVQSMYAPEFGAHSGSTRVEVQ